MLGLENWQIAVLVIVFLIFFTIGVWEGLNQNKKK